jgi:hypothetical protein
MTAILPVPCPNCGGLVDKAAIRCQRCWSRWDTAKELLYDGLCGASERAAKIAGAQEWNTADKAIQGMQDVQEALAVRGKYEIEIEKLERMETNEREYSKAYQPFAGSNRRGAGLPRYR